MTTRLVRLIPVLALASCSSVWLAESLLAQAASEPGGAKSVAGKWTMSVKAHGDEKMALELVQQGKKVTATLAPPHGGTIALEGELAGVTLTLAAPSKDGEAHLSMTATLKDDGTLTGYLSSVRGDTTWTAERVKDRPTSRAKGQP